MNNHIFIFSPSCWLGEGKIQLDLVEDELLFYTKWHISQKDAQGNVECLQQIQVKGLSEVSYNQLLFFDFALGNFAIELDNPSIGKVSGKGLISDQIIAWEFRLPEIGFEGFETYEKQLDDTYNMHAEYATTDQLRTVIRGKVWQEHMSKKNC